MHGVGVRARIRVRRPEQHLPQQLLSGAQPPLLAQVVVAHVELIEHGVQVDELLHRRAWSGSVVRVRR